MSPSVQRERVIGSERSVRPSTPRDGPEIVALMREAGLYPSTDPEHVFWKYWLKRDEWHNPRSYVLTDGARLLAHVAIVPTACRSESGRFRIASVVDWAARSRELGAGARLMKYVGTLTDALLGIHPNPTASKVMQLIGYKPYGAVTGYVRTLFPLRMLRRPVGANWRLLPRFARSTAWSLTAPQPAPNGWRTRPIGAEQVDQIASVLPKSRHGVAVLERGPPQLRYMLDCPTVPMKLYAVEHERQLRGYFILAFVPGQARLADYWIDSVDPCEWRALIQCAVAQAKQDDDVAELATWASDAMLAQCLEDCGFHARFAAPIYLRADGPSWIGTSALRVQMLDSDAAYLKHGDRRVLWA